MTKYQKEDLANKYFSLYLVQYTDLRHEVVLKPSIQMLITLVTLVLRDVYLCLKVMVFFINGNITQRQTQ